MNNDAKIYKFNFSYNEQKLIEEFQDRSRFQYHISQRDPSMTFDYKWLIKRVDSGYGKELQDYFKKILDLEDIRPRFYIQQPGYSLPWHTDNGTLCSINIVCNDDSNPISFRDEEIFYKIALLNTQVEHSVTTTTNERWLFRLSIFDKSYEEVKNSLIGNRHLLECMK